MALPPASVDPVADRVQVRLLREAGAARRASLGLSLSRSTIALARQAIRHRHPEFTEREVLLEFVRVHYGATLAAGVRSRLENRGA